MIKRIDGNIIGYNVIGITFLELKYRKFECLSLRIYTRINVIKYNLLDWYTCF